jgi:transcriptional regulator
MYRPAHFAADAAAVERLLAERPLCWLLSVEDGVPYASLCPLVAEPAAQGGALPVLWGHVARANRHHAIWRAQGPQAPVTVLVLGPSAYVSPNWYAPPSNAVPTWNYAAAQLRGRVTLVDEPAADKDALLKRLIAAMEPAYATQWRALPQELQSRMLQAIVGFRIDVDELLAKFKLSQNRGAVDRRRVAAALATSTDAEARAVAGWMARLGISGDVDDG